MLFAYHAITYQAQSYQRMTPVFHAHHTDGHAHMLCAYGKSVAADANTNTQPESGQPQSNSKAV